MDLKVNQINVKTGRLVKEDSSILNEADILESQIGAKGAEFINDTATHATSNIFTSLQVISDATISAYTTDTGYSITGNSLIGTILSTGTVIYGRFKSITLTSGKILAYKGI